MLNLTLNIIEGLRELSFGDHMQQKARTGLKPQGPETWYELYLGRQ